MELLQGARSKIEARQIQQSLRQLQFRVLPLSEAIGATAASLPLCTANVKLFSPIRALARVAFRP